MADRHQVVRGAVVMATADTQYEIVIPRDARNVSIRLTTTADYYAASAKWRWSKTAGQVAAGAGIFPMLAGEDLSLPGPLEETTLYIAHDDAASVTAHYAYQVPARA